MIENVLFAHMGRERARRAAATLETAAPMASHPGRMPLVSGGPAPQELASSDAQAPPRRPRVRKRLLVAGAVLILTALAFPYDLTVDTGWRTVRLTRVKAGVYQTSAPGEPTRIFFMEGCSAPAHNTRVTVRKGGTLGRLDLVDVIFPSGELCAGASLLGTRQEDYGVVQTASVGPELRVKRGSAHRLPDRKDTPHAS